MLNWSLHFAITKFITKLRFSLRYKAATNYILKSVNQCQLIFVASEIYQNWKKNVSWYFPLKNSSSQCLWFFSFLVYFLSFHRFCCDDILSYKKLILAYLFLLTLGRIISKCTYIPVQFVVFHTRTLFIFTSVKGLKSFVTLAQGKDGGKKIAWGTYTCPSFP
jgi:hypothetical protein